MKKWAVLLVFQLVFLCAFSQDSTFVLKRNNINVEFLGAGIFYSLNYERLFSLAEKARVGTALGYSFLPFNVPGQIHTIIPGASFIYGKKHNIEVGINIMADLSQPLRFGIPSARLGYRYQHNKFLFKAGFTPLIGVGFTEGSRLIEENKHFDIIPYGGLTIGYCF